MKDLISAVIFVVSLYAGTVFLRTVHDNLRKAALGKASQGLPSLVDLNRAIDRRRK